ncbi:MAG: alpha/beta hydrolase [Bacteroidia bacterium]|nr:alpha/beta hydrolase [Bacteroidia bacterium]
MRLNINLLLLSLLCFIILQSCEKLVPDTNSNDFFNIHRENGDIPVLVTGNTASGKICLFIQGGPALTAINLQDTDLYHWNDFEDDFAVAYYDRRGLGNSQGTFDTSQVNLKNEIQDLDAIIRVLHDKYNAEVYLLSHSWGGFTAASYLLGNPQPIAAWIDIDGFIVAPADTLWRYRRDFLQGVALQMLAEGQDTLKWNDALAWVAANPVIATPQQQKEWQAFLGPPGSPTNPPDPGFPPFGQELELVFFSSYNIFPFYVSPKWKIVRDHLLGEVANVDLRPQLYKITLPTLVIYGRYDNNLCPETGKDVFDLLGTPANDKDLLIVPESNHYPMYNNPDVTNPAIRDFILNH